MVLVHAIFAVILIVSLPSIAHAWGPGMHVEVAMSVLAKLTLVAPFIRELIKRYPNSFIYGAASPDIIVGKKYAGYFHHCHNWRIGWLILHEAKTDSQRAAAYGYLTHLAADVVAHNYYIPAKVVKSYTTRLLSHTYWEMRFDLGVGEDVWRKFNDITKDEIDDFDELLERVLKKTLFSFSTNKRIFNTILILQKMKRFRKSLSLYAKHSRFGIGEENRKHYVELTLESVFGFLSDPQRADCLEVDPAGIKKLAYAKALRRNIRSMLGCGLVDKKQVGKFIDLVKEELAIGLYRPEMLMPDVADIL